MIIDIRNLQDKVRFNEKQIKKCAETVLMAMGENRSELSILLVTDSYIRNLNFKYRHADSATDVLAFPMRTGNGASKEGLVLGDVVVSIETAKREAERRNIAMLQEICLYIIHGILHLLGYDDQKPADKKKMKTKERELLDCFFNAPVSRIA